MINFFYLFFKYWEFVLNNIPNYFQIDIGIIVNYNISQTNNSTPFNILILGFNFLRNSISSFSYYCKITIYGINSL